MTPAIVPGSPHDQPSAADLDAEASLASNDESRLQIVRTRAQHWLAGLTALTGLLTTVLVVKGPESVAKIETGWRIVIAVLLAGALCALAYGIYRAYDAAYGSPTALNEIDPQPLTGLATRLAAARSEAAEGAMTSLRNAVLATGIGIALVALGVGVSWFAPEQSSTGSGNVCVVVSGKKVLELSGGSVSVSSIDAPATLAPC